jgi:hypothetical protein
VQELSPWRHLGRQTGGMNDFLIKPFTPDALFETLLRPLSQRDV